MGSSCPAHISLDTGRSFWHTKRVIAGGRQISSDTLAQLQREAATLSQRQRARRLCELGDWKGPGGDRPLSVARQAVARLEREGLLPARSTSFPRLDPSSSKRPPPQPLELQPIECALEELGPIELVLIRSNSSQDYRLWKALLEKYHYLGAGPLCGAQLRYLVRSSKGVIGALAFSAAARRLRPRDPWIGWTELARRENLHRVVNNSRFLIPEPVKVPNLASHVLELAMRQLPGDWQDLHGYEPVLVETFVDRQQFAGVSYLAAGWQCIGVSSGRGRQDRDRRAQRSRKLYWVYPLVKNFRQVLCAEPPPEQRRLFHPPPPEPPPPEPPQDWAEAELGSEGLSPLRLRRRAAVILRDFFARPQSQIPQACGTRAKTKAAYRFFDHPQVNLQNVLHGHYQASRERAAACPVVLAVQDTTELNYSAHPGTELLGPIGEKRTQQIGLLVHDTMLYNTEGTPLGLLDVQSWAREEIGSAQHRRKQPIEAKESHKWLKSFEAASQLQGQCPNTQVVSVGDRESDVYELFVAAREDAHQTKLLVRAFQNRKVGEGEDLRSSLAKEPAVASMKLKVPRQKKRAARTAVVEVRYQAIELAPPKAKPKLGAVKLWAVWVKEVEPPAGEEPIEWLLLTNVPVESEEAAVERVEWYRLRFQIEVYHRTLKSGCKIEQRQLGNADRIESCLGLDMIVAWRIVHLTQLGKETPEASCRVFFEEEQWKAIYFFTTRQVPPKQAPTLRTIQWMVAQLGGFLGRKCDGSPGAKAMWLGLQRMDDITEMWRAMRSLDKETLLKLADSG